MLRTQTKKQSELLHECKEFFQTACFSQAVWKAIEIGINTAKKEKAERQKMNLEKTLYGH